MANFQTHLSIGLIVSISAAAWGASMGAYTYLAGAVLSVIGVLGSLLPDIDLDQSRMARMLFSACALMVATLVALVFFIKSADLLLGAVLWLVSYAALRYGAFYLFHRLTVHRGMVHSVPYMGMLSLLVVCIAFYALNLSAQTSWQIGAFLMLGALTHLLLDELFAVNIAGLKLKRSFGTALKLFERKKPLHYACLYALCFGFYALAPPLRLPV